MMPKSPTIRTPASVPFAPRAIVVVLGCYPPCRGCFQAARDGGRSSSSALGPCRPAWACSRGLSTATPAARGQQSRGQTRGEGGNPCGSLLRPMVTERSRHGAGAQRCSSVVRSELVREESGEGRSSENADGVFCRLGGIVKFTLGGRPDEASARCPTQAAQRYGPRRSPSPRRSTRGRAGEGTRIHLHLASDGGGEPACSSTAGTRTG